MLDTFRGLPVHVLVVHAVVVAVPLMSLISVLVAWRRRWRRHAAGPVLVLNALVVLLVLVAERSGDHLRDRIGNSAQIQVHADRGDKMIWFAIALTAASLLVALSRQASRPIRVVTTVLTIVAAVAASYWVVRTGEAGSSAVWKDVIANTTPGP